LNVRFYLIFKKEGGKNSIEKCMKRGEFFSKKGKEKGIQFLVPNNIPY